MVRLEQVAISVLVEVEAVVLVLVAVSTKVVAVDSVEALAVDLEEALAADLVEELELAEAVVVDLEEATEVDLEELVAFPDLALAHLFILDYKLMVMVAEVVMECCKVSRIDILSDSGSKLGMHIVGKTLVSNL